MKSFRPIFYILDADGNPIAVDDVHVWAIWFERASRVVDYDRIVARDGGAFEVSTVFLGIDHGFDDDAPTLWETMIFAVGSRLDLRTWRYATQADAVAGHANAVRLVRRLGRRITKTDH